MSLATPFTALALTLGLGLQPAAAQGCPCPGPDRGPRAEAMESRMAAALRLTDAQKASIKELRAKRKPGLEAKHKALKAAWTAFKEAEGKPETRPEELKALHRTASDLSFDLKLERRAMRKEIGALLTPEQREKAAYMLGRMEARRERGEGRGRGEGWGPRPDGDRGRGHDMPAKPAGAAQ